MNFGTGKFGKFLKNCENWSNVRPDSIKGFCSFVNFRRKNQFAENTFKYNFSAVFLFENFSSHDRSICNSRTVPRWIQSDHSRFSVRHGLSHERLGHSDVVDKVTKVTRCRWRRDGRIFKTEKTSNFSKNHMVPGKSIQNSCFRNPTYFQSHDWKMMCTNHRAD